MGLPSSGGTSRIVSTPRERAELLRLGVSFDHEIDDLMQVVTPATYKKWLRELRSCRRNRPAGRPRTPLAARNLVIRLAKENLPWGYRRIFGELKKLGIRISTSTIRNVLKEEGHFPEPNKAIRNPPIPWTTFVHANMESMVACDFFTKKIFTLRGVRVAYVLVFIHLGSRKVLCSSSTYHPDTAWVMQQARNAMMWMNGEDINPKFLVRDRDRIYPDTFEPFWSDVNVRSIKITPRAPMANTYCESFIGTLKCECWNHFMCFSKDQLDYIVRTRLRHYHKHRPHRRVGRYNSVLDENFIPKTEDQVRCRTELGGIIRVYYRDAA